MTNEEAIKYLKQLYPNGGHCWLDEQRIEAISMAVKTLQKDSVSEEWIEELRTKLDSMSKEDFKKVFDKYAIDFNEEPVSEDLEDFAKRQADVFAEREYEVTYDKAYLFKGYYWGCKAGAEWQKKQMMANTADAMIGLPYENKDGGYTHLIDVSRPLPVGNNKIAIIFKED